MYKNRDNCVIILSIIEVGEVMPKIDLSITIENQNNKNHLQTKAIIIEDEIIYKEKDDTLTHFNYEKNSLVRENKDLIMNYTFIENQKTEGTIKVKEFNKKIKVFIETKEIKKENHDIEIEFIVEDNHFIYRIEEIK